MVAEELGVPFIYVRPEPKKHGRKNQIEGELKKGQKVLVIEDLISTGKSSLAACDALIENGAEVIGVLAIFTYGFSSSKSIFSERGIPLETLTNYSAMIEEAVVSNYITPDDKKSLEAWNQDPVMWSANHNN